MKEINAVAHRVSVLVNGNSTLDIIVDKIIPPATIDFLNTKLFENRFLFLNRWSFVHFFAGAIFYHFFPKKFKLWIKINIGFEVFEFILGLGGNPLFVEEVLDTFWDIILSLFGFLAMKRLKEGK